MGHISALALFDYLAGKADLTTEETEHLQDCDDCRDDANETSSSGLRGYRKSATFSCGGRKATFRNRASKGNA